VIIAVGSFATQSWLSGSFLVLVFFADLKS